MQLPKWQYKTDLDMYPRDSKTVRLIRGGFFREERLNRGFTAMTTAIFSMSWQFLVQDGKYTDKLDHEHSPMWQWKISLARVECKGRGNQEKRRWRYEMTRLEYQAFQCISDGCLWYGQVNGSTTDLQGGHAGKIIRENKRRQSCRENVGGYDLHSFRWDKI